MVASRPSGYAVPSTPLVVAPPETSVHAVTVVEKGSFARALCETCAWTGPARRARAYAVNDIEEHQALTWAPGADDR